MRRYGACLGRLPRLERRVLVLRAALGRERGRTRARVAHIIGLSVRRVVRAERRGLKDLRAAGRRGGGAVAPSPWMATATAAAGVDAAEPPGAAALTMGMPGRTPRIEVKSDHASGSRNHGADTAPKDLSAALPLGDPVKPGGGFDPVVVIVPLLIALYVAWAVRGELRRSRPPDA